MSIACDSCLLLLISHQPAHLKRRTCSKSLGVMLARYTERLLPAQVTSRLPLQVVVAVRGAPYAELISLGNAAALERRSHRASRPREAHQRGLPAARGARAAGRLLRRGPLRSGGAP